MEKYAEVVQSKSPDRDIQSATATLCNNLKAFGHQLETYYKSA